MGGVEHPLRRPQDDAHIFTGKRADHRANEPLRSALDVGDDAGAAMLATRFIGGDDSHHVKLTRSGRGFDGGGRWAFGDFSCSFRRFS